MLDALGVVEAVDAEQQAALAAQFPAHLLGAGPHRRVGRQRLDLGEVDGDGEGAGGHGPAGYLDVVALRFEAEQDAGEPEEVLRAHRALEADQVGAEHALQDAGPPR